jgi:hypothetical protein
VSWRCGGEERGEKYKKLDDAASKMSSVCDQGGLLSWLRRRRFKIQATRCYYRQLDSLSGSGGTFGSAERKAGLTAAAKAMAVRRSFTRRRKTRLYRLGFVRSAAQRQERVIGCRCMGEQDRDVCDKFLM